MSQVDRIVNNNKSNICLLACQADWLKIIWSVYVKQTT